VNIHLRLTERMAELPVMPASIDWAAAMTILAATAP